MRFIVLRLGAGLAFAASVAGCGPRSVTIALHLPLGDDAVVTVTDETGWLRGATVPNSPALIDAPTTSVSNPTDDLSVLRLQWSGRRCLAKAYIRPRPGGAGVAADARLAERPRLLRAGGSAEARWDTRPGAG